MKMVTKALILAVVSAAAMSSAAEASYTLTFNQVGADIVATGSGSFVTAGLDRFRDFDSPATEPFFQPSLTTVLTGSTGFQSYFLNLTSTFGAFGPGGSTFGGVGAGAGVYFNNNGNGFEAVLGVPTGYTSGSTLTSSATFTNRTFADVGLRTGSYFYTFNAGAVRQFFQIVVDPTVINPPTSPATPAVPEPATWAMMLLGFGGIGFAMRRRKRKVTTTDAYA